MEFSLLDYTPRQIFEAIQEERMFPNVKPVWTSCAKGHPSSK